MRPTHPVLQQLQAVRHRANLITLQVGIFHGIAAAALLTAACLVAASRVPPENFTSVAVLGAFSTAAIVATAAGWTRSRWLGPEAAARRIDRAAALQDRLSTWLFADTLSPSPESLPVLAGQLAALSSAWQPRELVPRVVARLPAATCALALCILTATVLLSDLPMPPPPNTPSNAEVASGMTLDGSGSETTTGLASLASDRGRESAEQRYDRNSIGSSTDRSATAPNTSPLSGQAALHQGEATDRQDLAEVEPGRIDGKEQGGSREASHEPRHAAGRITAAEGQARGSARDTQPGRVTEPSSFDGSPPAAGGGTGSGRLFGTEGIAPTEPRQKFKLTLTAFLESTSGGNEPQTDPGHPRGARGRAENGINRQQREDDFLHKPEIPAELEDVVRRVYARDDPPAGGR